MGCKNYVEILKREVVPALGCTEPIAVAYAAAKAAQVLGKNPEKIEAWLSANILKNGMGVGIPGTGMTGLDISVSLGAVGGNADAELEVLKDVKPEDIELAKKMIDENKIDIKLKEVPDKLYIEVITRSGNEYAKVVIKGNHTNIVLIEANGKKLVSKNDENATACAACSACNEEELTIKDIYEFATTVDFEDIKFLLQGAKMNTAVSEEGLKNEYGLQVGKKLKNTKDLALFSDNLANKIVSRTAAGSDARMAGCTLPVMTTAGSGNQGITCTLPSVVMVEELGKTEEDLARALVISNLVTVHIKKHVGRLSPLCGCGIAAPTGTSCAITWLLGGKLENIEHAIKNMIGDMSGMICDGAKSSCALKIASSVNAAVQCAILAMNGIEVSEKDGIVAKDVEKTIKNLAQLGNEGMEATDRVILDIMVCK